MNLHVLEEISDEIVRQQHVWSAANDDNRKPSEWEWLISRQAERLTSLDADGSPGLRKDDYRERLIKIAALCVSAVEAFDRTEITKDVPEVPK